jgi:hypothetical protein
VPQSPLVPIGLKGISSDFVESLAEVILPGWAAEL